MLAVVCWLWGTKYGDDDVHKLRNGIARYLEQKHSFSVMRPAVCDEHLTKVKGCFCRLRMFDPEWQREVFSEDVNRIVCIDLDVVITGPLDPLFNRAENFVILHGANAANPCPVNGSLWMLRPGYRPDVWSDFSLEAAKKVPFYEFPDDQGWLHHKLPNAASWHVGPMSGVYAFQKPQWPKGDGLPSDARLVVFPGWRSPEKFKHLPWVKEHWVNGS